MARKRHSGGHENHERWLVSYADFITLLFAFFVVMFASSQTDTARAKQISDSVTDALNKGGVTATVREVLGGTVDDKGRGNAQMKGPGGATKAEPPPQEVLAELYPSLQHLTKALEDEIRLGKVELHLEPRGLVVSLRQATFFPSGNDSIEPKTYPSIEKIAEVIGPLSNSVRLEGHTDSVPIHTSRFRSNWELSASRAISMMQLLTEQFGIRRERMAIAGYADTMPLGSNDSDAGRAQNRRVDIVILNQMALVTEPGAPATARLSNDAEK